MNRNSLLYNKYILFSYIDILKNLTGRSYIDMTRESEGLTAMQLSQIKRGVLQLNNERLHAVIETAGGSIGEYVEFVQFIIDSGLHSHMTLLD